MPHFSRQNNLVTEGAYLDIIVYPAKAIYDQHQINKTQCPSITVRALIDTGATHSCIDEETVAQLLKLIARDKQKVGNAGGSSEQFLYDAGFKLPLPSTPIIALQVFGIDLKIQPYKALIGRDVLKFSNFIYSGTSNYWSLIL